MIMTKKDFISMQIRRMVIHIAFIDSNLYLIKPSRNYNAFLLLEKWTEGLPNEFAFHTKTITKKDESELYIFYSYKNSDAQKTGVYVVNQREPQYTLTRKLN